MRPNETGLSPAFRSGERRRFELGCMAKLGSGATLRFASIEPRTRVARQCTFAAAQRRSAGLQPARIAFVATFSMLGTLQRSCHRVATFGAAAHRTAAHPLVVPDIGEDGLHRGDTLAAGPAPVRGVDTLGACARGWFRTGPGFAHRVRRASPCLPEDRLRGRTAAGSRCQFR